MNNYEMSPLEDKKEYSFLFQKPEEYQVKVDEEGNYLTDLDSFEIPETAFDSGEDITHTFMGNDSVEFPYIIGSASEDNAKMQFKMPEYPSNNEFQHNKPTMQTPSFTDTYIPDAEHVMNYEPSYRDYLDTEIEEYNSDFGNETDFVSKPNNEVMENPSFDYNDYYDVENEDTFEYSDKMKSSEDEYEDEDSEYEEDEADEEEYDFEDEEESDEEEDDEDSEEYDEDDEDEEESDEEDEEEPKSKMRKENFKKMSEKMNKEVKEAISYLETYSSVTNKNLSLQEKVRCLSEAGYNKTIIDYIVSNTKSKHKSIKEVSKTPKLNKFIEKNNSKLLEKLYKEHKLSLKEQKLFEGLTELNKHILKQTPILLNLMTTRNPTFEGLESEPERQEQLKERFTTISNLIGMIPSLYTIAIASFVEDQEQSKKENYSIRNKKIKFREQDPPAQGQPNQSQGQQPQQGEAPQQGELPSSQDQAKIGKINTAWIETLTALTQLTMVIQKNTIKVTQQVGTLGKIKALATKIGSKLGNLFKAGVNKAKQLKKTWWDDLGDTEEVDKIAVGGKPVNTGKI